MAGKVSSDRVVEAEKKLYEALKFRFWMPLPSVSVVLQHQKISSVSPKVPEEIVVNQKISHARFRIRPFRAPRHQSQTLDFQGYLRDPSEFVRQTPTDHLVFAGRKIRISPYTEKVSAQSHCVHLETQTNARVQTDTERK
jgi:hypothetical protein